MQINYSKLRVTWKNNLNNIYKENTIIGVGQEAVINFSSESISNIYVNFEVDGEVYTDLVQIERNIIHVPFKTDVLKKGTHKLEIVAYLKNGDVVPSPTFSYYVEDAIENPNDITAETNYPILIQLLEEVEEWNENVKRNEVERQESENTRMSNENTRMSNENTRISNENTRQSNESNRQQYETQRRVEEDERLTDEQVRVNAENIRIANENERLRKEIERQNAEELRQIAYNSSLYGRMDEAEDKLNEVNSQLTSIEINIENLLKNGLVLPSGGDDTQAIQNMLDTNKKVTLTKGVYNISSLTIPSGGQIIGTKNATIKASGEKAFYFPKDIGNLSFKNFTIQTSNSVYCFYFDGELGSVITDGVIEDVKIIGFITPVYAKYLRKFNFNRISSHCKNFMEYTGKSAEVNINNSYLVHYFDTDEDSFGIKSYAEGEYYPEGLMINNTLIYHFERNFDITDLMVSNFTNIHSDSVGKHCLPNRIRYNKLTQTIIFDTCWFYSSKFIIGDEVETTGKSYRMNIKNCCFEGCEDGVTIQLNKFVSDVNISNCRFTRSTGASNCIGIVCIDGNNYINIHDLDFYGFISYIQFKGYGSRNSTSNIPNNDNLETPFYLQYPVTTNNVFCKFKSYYINRGFNVTSGSEIINKELNLGEGVYVCKVKMNQLNISTEGFVGLNITGDNVYSSSGEGWSSSYCYIRNKEFETSFYFNISNPCKVNVNFKSDGAVFTVGYHSYMEIIKL